MKCGASSRTAQWTATTNAVAPEPAALAVDDPHRPPRPHPPARRRRDRAAARASGVTDPDHRFVEAAAVPRFLDGPSSPKARKIVVEPRRRATGTDATTRPIAVDGAIIAEMNGVDHPTDAIDDNFSRIFSSAGIFLGLFSRNFFRKNDEKNATRKVNSSCER